MQLPEHLLQTFIEESREYIDLLDEEIVRLESESDNQELIDEIFRAFHTLKGNSGMVNLKKFEKVAHKTEEVLTGIRDQTRAITSDLISFILDSLDQLKILLTHIENTGNEDIDIQ